MPGARNSIPIMSSQEPRAITTPTLGGGSCWHNPESTEVTQGLEPLAERKQWNKCLRDQLPNYGTGWKRVDIKHG